jgi:molybdopterin-guanine dinucleotide biosynthesis protein A
MTGVVLCGGSSTRMGTDKGLLKDEEQTWAELAARKLTALQLPVVISVNQQQRQLYEQIFFPEQLIVDSDSFSAKAPLFGLLSVHLQFSKEDLFVLACDIKNMTTDLMQQLLDEYKQETHEAYVYQTGETPQPLCGIYTASGLCRIYDLLRKGKLKRFSMMYALEVLNTKYIPVKDTGLAFFNNYNSPEEL